MPITREYALCKTGFILRISNLAKKKRKSLISIRRGKGNCLEAQIAKQWAESRFWEGLRERVLQSMSVSEAGLKLYKDNNSVLSKLLQEANEREEAAKCAEHTLSIESV